MLDPLLGLLGPDLSLNQPGNVNTPSPSPTNSNPADSTASPQPNSPKLLPTDAPSTPTPSPTPSPSPSGTDAAPNSPSPSPTPTKSDASPASSPTPVVTIHHTTVSHPGGGISTITSTISAPGSAPTFHSHPAPSPSTPPSTDNSGGGGLSGGAITAIAIVAGILGFVLLFWVGVQILQSKRRRREEAEMQEIDFGPTGNSVNGDLPFPRASGAMERGPASLSGSNSLNRSMGYQKTAGHAGHYGAAAGYGDETVAHSDNEYVTDPGLQVDYESGLNRQPTLVAPSGYSASAASAQHFYPTNAAPSRPPAPYTNYPPYPGHYGAPPPPIRYEPPSSALNYDYTTPTQYPASNPGPNGDYHH
ncbi:uncharacterized protein VP01_993g9 [Puccinia sorghi]|uniref:Uncharacterized protein n=1 Tax=Puccinia sorghi TaxID=27349 RepID=A0A0L6U5C7_9BASI|nr:uncharacterized protein VP01_993g9 [Puccinia sorghi]